MADQKVSHTCPQFQHRIVYAIADLDGFKNKLMAEKNNFKAFCFENRFEMVTPQKQLDLYNINSFNGQS